MKRAAAPLALLGMAMFGQELAIKEDEMEANGLRFTIKDVTITQTRVSSISAILTSKSEKDWRAQYINLTADCDAGHQQIKFSIYLASIEPGENSLKAAVPARKGAAHCEHYSLKAVKFIRLSPVDDLTQSYEDNMRKYAADSAKARSELARLIAEQHARETADCHALYQATADRKMADLTVAETGQVKACQDLGMYR